MRAALLLLLALPGCAFFNDVNRLGADLDLGVGGGALAEVVGDVHLKLSVAIERRDGDADSDPADPAYALRRFL